VAAVAARLPHRCVVSPLPPAPSPLTDSHSRADYGHAEVADRFGKDPREVRPALEPLPSRARSLTLSSLALLQYSISTKEFVAGPDGRIAGVNTVRVAWEKDAIGQWKMSEVPDSKEFFPADLILLALGFLGPEDAAIKSLGLEQDGRSNIKTPQGKYATAIEGVFAAGDCRRGQVRRSSLVLVPPPSLQQLTLSHSLLAVAYRARHQRGPSDGRRGRPLPRRRHSPAQRRLDQGPLIRPGGAQVVPEGQARRRGRGRRCLSVARPTAAP